MNNSIRKRKHTHSIIMSGFGNISLMVQTMLTTPLSSVSCFSSSLLSGTVAENVMNVS